MGVVLVSNRFTKFVTFVFCVLMWVRCRIMSCLGLKVLLKYTPPPLNRVTLGLKTFWTLVKSPGLVRRLER